MHQKLQELCLLSSCYTFSQILTQWIAKPYSGMVGLRSIRQTVPSVLECSGTRFTSGNKCAPRFTPWSPPLVPVHCFSRSIIQLYGCFYHSYTDDIQFDLTTPRTLLSVLCQHLQLNLYKTKLLIFPATVTIHHNITVPFGYTIWSPLRSARILGVITAFLCLAQDSQSSISQYPHPDTVTYTPCKTSGKSGLARICNSCFLSRHLSSHN